MPVPIRPGQIMSIDSVLNFIPVSPPELEGTMIDRLQISPTTTLPTLRLVDEVTSSASSDGGVRLDTESPVTVSCLDETALPTDSGPGPASNSGADTFRLNPEVAVFVPQVSATSLPINSSIHLSNLNPESSTFVPAAPQAPASNTTVNTSLTTDDTDTHSHCSYCDMVFPGIASPSKQDPAPIDTPPSSPSPPLQPLVQGILPATPSPGGQPDTSTPPSQQQIVSIGFPYAGAHNIPTRALHPPPAIEDRRSTLVNYTMALLHTRGINWTRVQPCIRTPINDPTSWPRPTILIIMDLIRVDREALDTAFREILLFAEQELELPAINVEAVDTLYAPATTDDANHNSNNNNHNIIIDIDNDDDFILPDFEDSLLAEMDRLANMDVYPPPPYVWVNFVRIPDFRIHVCSRVYTPRLSSPQTPRLRPVEGAGITEDIPPLDNQPPMPPNPRLEGIDHPDIDDIPLLQLSPCALDGV
ncbi:hypothetical protein BJX65DRAFT_312768 [Aspergillus insuetus]